MKHKKRQRDKQSYWNKTIFRKNDIRGIYKKDFDLHFVQNLAFAFVTFCQKYRLPRLSLESPQAMSLAPPTDKKLLVALGHDARLSSPEIAQCLSTALKTAHADICFLGLVPSPLCFFASHFFKDISASIMVTASHNPPAFNGFKMMVKKESVCDQKIKQLYQIGLDLILKNRKSDSPAQAQKNQVLAFEQQAKARINKIKPVRLNTSQTLITAKDVESAYISCLQKKFLNLKKTPHQPKLNRFGLGVLDIVVDCGNGASGPLAQKVFQALKDCPVRVHWLYAKPDGRFPHHHPDPSCPENLKDLKDKVQKSHSLFGVAFDGDGDRLVVVMRNGKILEGDELMSIFISNILEEQGFNGKTKAKPLSQNKIPKPLVVADVKCADWFFAFLKTKPLRTIMWKSGHSLIRQKTIKEKAIFGGELSGHFFFPDNFFPIDDGLYGLLRLLAISLRQGQGPGGLIVPKTTVETTEIRYPVKDEDEAQNRLKCLKAFYQKEKKAQCVSIDGVRVSFPDRSWGLARFSNTQKEWTFRFGGHSLRERNKIQKNFYQILGIG